jgi:hypothetical protein
MELECEDGTCVIACSTNWGGKSRRRKKEDEEEVQTFTENVLMRVLEPM